MNIFPTIEALLQYANAHLLFDELDFVYARNRILDLLNLSDYEEYQIDDAEIDEMTNPDQLLDALTSYAVAQKIIADDNRCDFGKRLMSCVLKRPSEIADIFASLPANKGFEWLYDYGVKSGTIRPINKKWEAKATRGRLEVAFTGCKCGAKGCCSPDSKSKAYPACNYCRENEGFKDKINMRTVPIELGDERVFFYFKKKGILQNEGMIVSEYHRELEINRTSLNKMFDFISLMPWGFIAAKEGGHERYSVATKLTPLSKAPDKTRFKSPEYPYINITIIDWYFGAVRLLCTNREKLIEYADKVIAKWKSLGNNEVAVSIRKVESQYCIELMMLEKGRQVAAEFGNLAKMCNVLNLMGVFGIGQAKEDQLKRIEKFVSKEEKFSPAKLEGDMAENAEMINRLLLTVGSSKPSELEASLDVKDEINKTLENALISLNVPIDGLYANF